MTVALYAGSFDPFTNGHLDILEQACEVFDKVIVAVANNSCKSSLLPTEVRVSLIKESVKHIKNVEVTHYDGLTVEFAKQYNVDVLVRGLRSSSDFEYEMQIAYTNRDLDERIKAVFFLSKPIYNHISSTAIRDILKYGGDISKFVPSVICKYFIN